MLAKRIIPCLDVKNGRVVKGVQFKNHREVGDSLECATRYCEAGADELVFYDITASADQRSLDCSWINEIARFINIPFCVAGGIRTLHEAEKILNAGADKISINSPALENPEFITELANEFGEQCVVIGMDSDYLTDDYYIFQYTGDSKKIINTQRRTKNWIKEVTERGAGEIVLNCMNQDGMRNGYDIQQLNVMRLQTSLPLVASGGAGTLQDFLKVFQETSVNAALAASVFHSNEIDIQSLKFFLREHNVEIRV